jgi:hypothetical protein
LLSPELKARIVLEDNGWNWFRDPPLCSLYDSRAEEERLAD